MLPENQEEGQGSVGNFGQDAPSGDRLSSNPGPILLGPGPAAKEKLSAVMRVPHSGHVFFHAFKLGNNRGALDPGAGGTWQ